MCKSMRAVLVVAAAVPIAVLTPGLAFAGDAGGHGHGDMGPGDMGPGRDEAGGPGPGTPRYLLARR